MTSPCALLEIRQPGSPARFHRAPLPVTLGRAADVDLQLDDPEVSGHHAKLFLQDGALRLQDQGSTNGTFLAGRRVQETGLGEHQAFRIGETVIQMHALAPDASRVLRLRPLSTSTATQRVVRLPAVLASDGTQLHHLDEGTSREGHVLLLPAGDGVRMADLGATTRRWRTYGEGEPIRLGAHIVEVLTGWERVSRGTDLAFASDGGTVLRERAPALDTTFPPTWFATPQVSTRDLLASGLPIHESDYLALGGGLGSFTWVDALRVHGVPTSSIRVVGFESVPYARYKRLCRHSQIPDHERLRSNSESCPDNIWGFPGYGLREALHSASRGRLGHAFGVLRTLVREPDLSDTYTPRAIDVFHSIDREAERIGWDDMLTRGRIRSIRKTDDGRYAVACSSLDGGRERGFFVASTLHVALGYPGVRFLPDLRAYRDRTRDFHRVVNAYEDHDHVYQRLEEQGGRVALRGRGIVASRVLQRLHEARQRHGRPIEVVHLMRSPRTAGQRSGRTGRDVEHHWEFQPFNWPESCWGGTLAEALWRAGPEERKRLLDEWGGTTTAARSDWREIVSGGLRAGWYRLVFGRIEQVREEGADIALSVRDDDHETREVVDYIIDATGLVADLQADPVLSDMADTYDLQRNVRGGLEILRSFEVEGMRNEQGRLFAAGVTTLGGGYAPVDSFLGLQYAAAASLDALSPRVPPLTPMASFSQWTRWARGVAP